MRFIPLSPCAWRAALSPARRALPAGPRATQVQGGGEQQTVADPGEPHRPATAGLRTRPQLVLRATGDEVNLPERGQGTLHMQGQHVVLGGTGTLLVDPGDRTRHVTPGRRIVTGPAGRQFNPATGQLSAHRKTARGPVTLDCGPALNMGGGTWSEVRCTGLQRRPNENSAPTALRVARHAQLRRGRTVLTRGTVFGLNARLDAGGVHSSVRTVPLTLGRSPPWTRPRAQRQELSGVGGAGNTGRGIPGRAFAWTPHLSVRCAAGNDGENAARR